MKINWRVELSQWVIIAAMFVAAILIWPSVPSRIPVHWNAAGKVDGYGGKAEGLLLLPAIALGIYLLLLFIPRIDPGRANYVQFSGPYLIVRYAVLVMMAAIDALILLAIKGVGFDMTRVILGVMGLLFIVLGNVMGKLRPNWFVGVRTPWTLSSKRSWVRTHRLAGWLFTLAGLVFLASIAVDVSRALPVLIIAVVAVISIVPIVYSYIEWRRDPEKSPPSGTSPG